MQKSQRIFLNLRCDESRFFATGKTLFRVVKQLIIAFTMQVAVVYWEYAFAENFVLDGLLLYLALRIAHARVHPLNLLLATLLGAAEAVLFPLVEFPFWAAYTVKIAGGILLVLIAVRKGSFREYCAVCAAFFTLTFALGGLLVAAYSFFGAKYEAGNAFLVERAPVALVLGLAGAFAVVTVFFVRRFYRYARLRRNLFACELTAGSKVHVTGFADSGNLLTFRSCPVCVLSPVAALALFCGREQAGRIAVSTVNGTRELPVFECEISVALDGGKRAAGRVYVTVGDVAAKEYQLILHTAILEGKDERITVLKDVACKDRRKRQRCKLSVRK